MARNSDITDVRVKTRPVTVDGAPKVERKVEYRRFGKTQRRVYTTTPEVAEIEDAQAAFAQAVAERIHFLVEDMRGTATPFCVASPYFLRRSYRDSSAYVIGGILMEVNFASTRYDWEARKHEIILPDAKTGNYRGSPDIIYDLTVNRDGTPKFGKTVAKRIAKLIVEADRRRREREAAKRRKIKANLHAQCLLNLLRREARGKGVVFALADTWGDTAEVVVRSKRGKVTTNRHGDVEFHSVVTVNVEVTADGLGGIEVFSHPGRLKDPADALEEVGRVTANMARLCKLARLEIASLTHLETM